MCPATARPGAVPFGAPLAARLRAAVWVMVARPESRPSGPTRNSAAASPYFGGKGKEDCTPDGTCAIF
eukprot:scaffold11075_cov132-Isochrysis_galbana.AAC.5